MFFYDRFIPVALIEREKHQFELPGIPYPNVRHINTLRKKNANKFVHVIAEIVSSLEGAMHHSARRRSASI